MKRITPIKAMTAAKPARMPTSTQPIKLPTIPQHREKLAGMAPPVRAPRKGKL